MSIKKKKYKECIKNTGTNVVLIFRSIYDTGMHFLFLT
jgi:hypothetical protein